MVSSSRMLRLAYSLTDPDAAARTGGRRRRSRAFDQNAMLLVHLLTNIFIAVLQSVVAGPRNFIRRRGGYQDSPATRPFSCRHGFGADFTGRPIEDAGYFPPTPRLRWEAFFDPM